MLLRYVYIDYSLYTYTHERKNLMMGNADIEDKIFEHHYDDFLNNRYCGSALTIKNRLEGVCDKNDQRFITAGKRCLLNVWENFTSLCYMLDWDREDHSRWNTCTRIVFDFLHSKGNVTETDAANAITDLLKQAGTGTDTVTNSAEETKIIEDNVNASVRIKRAVLQDIRWLLKTIGKPNPMGWMFSIIEPLEDKTLRTRSEIFMLKFLYPSSHYINADLFCSFREFFPDTDFMMRDGISKMMVRTDAEPNTQEYKQAVLESKYAMWAIEQERIMSGGANNDG